MKPMPKSCRLQEEDKLSQLKGELIEINNKIYDVKKWGLSEATEKQVIKKLEEQKRHIKLRMYDVIDEL